jgi:hypothetical protein
VSATTLIRDYAERVLDLSIGGDATLDSAYLVDDPAAVPSVQVTQARLTYVSRNGSAWKLDTVQCRGHYIATDELPHFAGLTPGPAWFYPSDPVIGRKPVPSWLGDLIAAFQDPGHRPTTGAITVKDDQARLTRYLELSGTAEIPYGFPTENPVASPMRPNRLKLTYLTRGGGRWLLDAAVFSGPYVATGQEPRPGQNEGERPYYPRSRELFWQAPRWVRDLLRKRSSLPPLAQSAPA